MRAEPNRTSSAGHLIRTANVSVVIQSSLRLFREVLPLCASFVEWYILRKQPPNNLDEVLVEIVPYLDLPVQQGVAVVIAKLRCIGGDYGNIRPDVCDSFAAFIFSLILQPLS
jgi:hypothetical protein